MAKKISSILGLLVIILLILAIFRVFSGYDPLNFTTLLELLSDAPNIHMSLSSSMDIISINGKWVILDELRVFLNLLGDILGVIVWGFSGLAQCVVYVGYFLSIMFV